jgi:hypothetical protein
LGFQRIVFVFANRMHFVYIRSLIKNTFVICVFLLALNGLKKKAVDSTGSITNTLLLLLFFLSTSLLLLLFYSFSTCGFHLKCHPLIDEFLDGLTYIRLKMRSWVKFLDQGSPVFVGSSSLLSGCVCWLPACWLSLFLDFSVRKESRLSYSPSLPGPVTRPCSIQSRHQNLHV